MKVKPLYLIVPAILIIGAMFFVPRPAKSAVTVKIDQNGFHPNSVKIKAGGTVTWVSTEGYHWPASDPHPTHENYPAGGGCLSSQLDACKALGKDQTFRYKFDAKGRWGVHDHLMPGAIMLVTVE